MRQINGLAGRTSGDGKQFINWSILWFASSIKFLKSAFDLFHPMVASSFDNMFSQPTAVEVKILPVAGILINFPIFCKLLSVENHQRALENHIKTPFNSNIVVNGNEQFNYCNFLTGMFVIVGGVRKFWVQKFLYKKIHLKIKWNHFSTNPISNYNPMNFKSHTQPPFFAEKPWNSLHHPIQCPVSCLTNI